MRPANTRESGVNLTQSAYELLRADILSCRLPPGSKLKIQELCTRYAVGLGAIREALSRLTSEGLVIAEPQRGRAGVSWVRLATDFPTGISQILSGDLRWKDYWRSLRGVDVDAVISREDPWPGVAELLLLPYMAVRRGF